MLKAFITTAVATTFAVLPDSGLGVGEMVSTFHPWHVTGPNKGTDACPP